MRKKFVTVALLGTLIFTSTNFVGCKDYDDDINKLQEQVDALKSISISDLASQLQSLKDANGNLSVANAKMEAAIAEIKTNIEALKEADKTLTSLVNGKVDQSTYQAAIKELNEKCTDLANKVAALASLETAVNDLKANKVDKSVIDELKKTIEKLQSQDSDFATRIGKLENTVESLNTVLAGKADQTTVAALSTAIDELKKSVAGVDTKIAAALDPIQKSITKLQEDLAKKADAATVAADIEKVKSEMTAVTDALKTETAANLAAVKAELVGRITALETAKGQMDVQIGKLETDITALKERITKLENQPATDLNAVKADIAANKTAIDGALSTIGSIQGTITGIEDRLDGLGTEVGAVKKYIDEANSTLSTAIISQITSDIAAAVSSLQSEYAQADAELATRIETLEGLDTFDKTDYDALKSSLNSLKETVGDEKSGLVKDLKDLELKVSNLITDALAAKGEGTIDAAIAKQIQNTLENSAVIKAAIEAAISDVTGKVDKIDQELNSVLERIQSIVFVPQYKDNSGNAIVPVYKIDNKNGTVEMKFRISPIDKVAELVKLGTANPGIFSFYKEDALQSRATSENALVATEVKAGTDAGTIVIKAEVSNNLAATSSTSYYPVALKLSTSKEYGTAETPDTKPINDITTEYFNVSVKDITSQVYSLAANQTILYTDVAEKAVNSLTVNVDYGVGSLTLAQCGFTQNLVIYAVKCSGTWVKVGSLSQANKDEIKGKGFEVVGNTAVKLISPIDINRVDNELEVQLADNDIFGTTGSSAPEKTFDVTYKIVKNDVGATIDYSAITKAALQSGSDTYFDVNAQGEFVWKNTSSDGAQTFIIKAEKASKFTNNLIDGATAAEILAAIEGTLPANIEHKIGADDAGITEPTFTFDVAGDKIIVALPANAERKTYAMSTIYNTGLYGKIVLKATLKLAYPTAKQLWSHNQERWTTDGDYFVNYTPDVSGAPYYIEHDLKTGYVYSPVYASGVSYTYELVPNGVSVLPAGISIVSGSNGNSVLKFTRNVDLSKFRVKFTAIIGTHVAQTETFDVTMTYPITDKIAIPTTSLEYGKAGIESHAGLPIFKGVNLVDRFNTPVIKDGKIVTSPAWGTAYGLTGGTNSGNEYVLTDGVRYVIKKAVLENGDAMALSSFEIANDGKFHLKENNLAKKVTVTVQIKVTYTYCTVLSDEFAITLEPTL